MSGLTDPTRQEVVDFMTALRESVDAGKSDAPEEAVFTLDDGIFVVTGRGESPTLAVALGGLASAHPSWFQAGTVVAAFMPIRIGLALRCRGFAAEFAVSKHASWVVRLLARSYLWTIRAARITYLPEPRPR